VGQRLTDDKGFSKALAHKPELALQVSACDVSLGSHGVDKAPLKGGV
jgi:hypothetical protein